MRALIYQTLKSYSPITDIVGNRIYQANQLDTTPQTPYLVFKVGVETPRIADARQTMGQFWAHYRPGSYLKIDNLLKAVKEALESIPNEGRFFQAEWLDDSEDLVDDASLTWMRFSRYQLINR